MQHLYILAIVIEGNVKTDSKKTKNPGINLTNDVQDLYICKVIKTSWSDIREVLSKKESHTIFSYRDSPYCKDVNSLQHSC